MSHAADEAPPRQAMHPASASEARRRQSRRIPWIGIRRQTIVGWLFVLPALTMYGLFVLQPLALTVQYSLYRWDGVGPATWVGLSNYATVLSDPKLVETLFNAFRLVLFYSVIPVALGLVTASVIHRIASGRLGTVSRTVLFLPQVIPLVAAGIIWGRLLSLNGLINQALTAIGLGDITRAWLGDFDFALPAVGLIGIWVLLGFCTVLLLTGMTRIDTALFESARLDGAGWFQEFRFITVPSLRYEVGVCVTVTVIAALAAFDIVYVATGGGPGNATAVPGHPDLHPGVPRTAGRPGLGIGSRPDRPRPHRHPSDPAHHAREGAMRVARREVYAGQSPPACADRDHDPAVPQHLHDGPLPVWQRSCRAVLPPDPKWGNFLEAFKVANMSALMASSVFIVLAVVPISLLISTMAGFAIGSLRIPGGGPPPVAVRVRADAARSRASSPRSTSWRDRWGS